MRIEIKLGSKCDHNSEEAEALRKFMESHPDDKEGHFIVYDYIEEAVPFKFVYKWILGCHRLFLYDPYNDKLVDIYAEYFPDIWGYILLILRRHHDLQDVEILF